MLYEQINKSMNVLIERNIFSNDDSDGNDDDGLDKKVIYGYNLLPTDTISITDCKFQS